MHTNINKCTNSLLLHKTVMLGFMSSSRGGYTAKAFAGVSEENHIFNSLEVIQCGCVKTKKGLALDTKRTQNPNT